MKHNKYCCVILVLTNLLIDSAQHSAQMLFHPNFLMLSPCSRQCQCGNYTLILLWHKLPVTNPCICTTLIPTQWLCVTADLVHAHVVTVQLSTMCLVATFMYQPQQSPEVVQSGAKWKLKRRETLAGMPFVLINQQQLIRKGALCKCAAHLFELTVAK